MTGKRFRCMCGTVYDPAQHSVCPACGTVIIKATDPPPTAAPRVDATPASSNPVPVPVIDRGVSTEQRKSQGGLARLAIGAVVIIGLAIGVRAKWGGAPPSKTAPPAGTGEVDKGGDERLQPDDPGSETSLPPEPGVNPEPTPRRPAPAPAPPSDVAAFKGKWKLLTARMQPEAVIPGLPVTRSILAHTVMTAFASAGAVSTLNITDAGTYVLEVDVKGDGFYTSNITPDKHLLSVAAQGVLTLTPSGVDISDRARVMLKPVKFDMPQLDIKANDTELSLLPVGASGGAPSTWFRPGDSGREHGDILGAWSYPQVFVDSYMAYRGTLELQDGGNYKIRFTRSEQGMLIAAGGDYEFKRSINMGPPVQGRYEFDGPNRFTLTEPRGTATWVREGGTQAPVTPPKPKSRGLRQ